MNVKKLLHTRMRVSDLDETIRFYTTVLGLEVIERKTSPRGSHLAFLRVPNSEELIELVDANSQGDGTSWVEWIGGWRLSRGSNKLS